MTHTANNQASTAFHRMVIYNGYPLSVVIAVSFHSILLAVLLFLQNSYKPEALELVQPTVIKALFIDENPQLRNERIIEQQRVQREEDQRREQQQLEQEQQAAQQRRVEEEATRERALLLEREALERQRELARQQALLLEREELARQQALLLEREELARQQAQRDREQAEQRQQQENERIRQQQASNEAAAAQAARTEFELVQSATALIQQLVQAQWSRPPSARNGMRAVIQIRMLPNGDLLGEPAITQSSGDPAFDRSAQNAVYGAAPFRELTSLPINVFNENFRTLSLIFQPEDLLN